MNGLTSSPLACASVRCSEGGRPYQVTYREKQAPPDPISMSRDEKFPPDLAEVIKKCICWDPRDRFSGFRDMRIALASVYEGLFGRKTPYEELGLVGLAADGLNNQGISYLELGRKEDAARCWREALKKDPTHPETTYNLSLFQWRSAEIDDTEVLRRLDNCRNNPSISLPFLEELTACVHAERFDPDAAEHTLRRSPETYECLFSGTDTHQIKGIRTFTGHRKCVSAAAITRDGKLALSGSWDRDLRVWDLTNGRCVHTLMGHTSFVNSVAVAGAKGLALSGSHDRTVRLWDLDAGTCIRIMGGIVMWSAQWPYLQRANWPFPAARTRHSNCGRRKLAIASALWRGMRIRYLPLPLQETASWPFPQAGAPRPSGSGRPLPAAAGAP